jgi:RNA polymerase sigma-70 factor (ECF subfamily)
MEARSAFLLRRMEGLEQKDIAIRLGISLSTVKRHIALAYARCYAIAYAD